MPKGLQNVVAAAQPITGESSIEAALAALSPQEQAAIMAGVDPYAGSAVMGGQAAVAPEMMGQTGVQSGLTPEARMAIAENLSAILNSVGAPTNEADAAFTSSIQNAIMALGL